MRSLLATARIVRGATSGAVLLQDGTTCPLRRTRGPRAPGRGLAGRGHRPGALLAGQVYRSFMWPARNGHGATDHVRMTVLAAAGTGLRVRHTPGDTPCRLPRPHPPRGSRCSDCWWTAARISRSRKGWPWRPAPSPRTMEHLLEQAGGARRRGRWPRSGPSGEGRYVRGGPPQALGVLRAGWITRPPPPSLLSRVGAQDGGGQPAGPQVPGVGRGGGRRGVWTTFPYPPTTATLAIHPRHAAEEPGKSGCSTLARSRLER